MPARSGRVAHRGHGLDLDQPVVVVEHGDTEQGARRVVLAEPVPDRLSGRDEIRLPGRGDQRPGADHVLDGGAGLGERGAHRVEGDPGLTGVVTGRGGVASYPLSTRFRPDRQPGRPVAVTPIPSPRSIRPPAPPVARSRPGDRANQSRAAPAPSAHPTSTMDPSAQNSRPRTSI